MNSAQLAARRKAVLTGTALHVVVLLAFVGFLVPLLLAQDAVPNEILQRTRFIRVGDEGSTAFCVDYHGKIYLVTARHVVAGVPQIGATIQVWDQESWKDYKTVRTLFPESEDVDIAVFETTETIKEPYQVTLATEGGPTMGQQLWFLGYPWGLRSRFGNGQAIPFIKRGTMSAIDGTNPKSVVVYIDGFNNPGFSGGPILYWDFSSHTYKILGVVKGYKEDTAKVLVNGVHTDTQLLVNSGILIGYSSQHILEAIVGADKKAKNN